MKKLGEVFNPLLGNIPLQQDISSGALTQLHIYKQARSIVLSVSFDGLIERNKLFEAEKKIASVLNAISVKINPKFPSE